MYLNLYAFTAPGANLPEYISVNKVDGGVAITVRGAPAYGGHTAQIVLDETEFKRFCKSMQTKPKG